MYYAISGALGIRAANDPSVLNNHGEGPYRKYDLFVGVPISCFLPRVNSRSFVSIAS